MGIKVMFFRNGNTIAFEDGQQAPELNESWFMLYVGMLAAHGIDVEQVEFTMPDTRRAKVESIPDGGFNWVIEQGE